MTELEAMKIWKARERQEDRSVPAGLDRSRWVGCSLCKGVTGWTQDLDDEHHEVEFLFCPVCGRPITEEAWAELERRIGGNNEAD